MATLLETLKLAIGERTYPQLRVLSDDEIAADTSALAALVAKREHDKRQLPIVCECEQWRDLMREARTSRNEHKVAQAISQAWIDCEMRRRIGKKYSPRLAVAQRLRKSKYLRDALGASTIVHVPIGTGPDRAINTSARHNGAPVAQEPTPPYIPLYARLTALDALWSEAERRIVRHVIAGVHDRQTLADTLGCAVTTINDHVQNMRSKVEKFSESAR